MADAIVGRRVRQGFADGVHDGTIVATSRNATDSRLLHTVQWDDGQKGEITFDEALSGNYNYLTQTAPRGTEPELPAIRRVPAVHTALPSPTARSTALPDIVLLPLPSSYANYPL